ncbi:MAG: hypothetical protein ABIJ75_07965, partial [Actinomycetota bacterium]
ERGVGMADTGLVRMGELHGTEMLFAPMTGRVLGRVGGSWSGGASAVPYAGEWSSVEEARVAVAAYRPPFCRCGVCAGG